jgi:prephenate dehydrogenase
MTTPKTLAIVGTGMIGCSFAAALRQNHPHEFSRILGYSAGKSSEKAKELGHIDETASLEEIFQVADVILLATPLLVMEKIIQNSPPPHKDQLIIDAGSVKNFVLQVAKKSWKENATYFVPCHPIAGLERTGPEVADPHLFENKRVIITPDEETCVEKINYASKLWQMCNAKIYTMTACKHDAILSKVSHLPHLLSFALVAGQYERDGDSCFQWSAGGFKDFTRIASSNPKMWHDICLTNPTEITNALDDYINDLQKLKSLVQEKRSGTIEELFLQSKEARDNFYQSIDRSKLKL